MIFAEKLQAERKERRLSQENLADILGVSRQAISKWESGQSFPDTDKLVKISRYFGVSLDYLIMDGAKNTGPDPEDGPYSLLVPRRAFQYEYRSKATLFGLPLVHINIGCGLLIAKGVIAVGNIAVGAVSVGAVALGGLCVGGLAVGLLSLAGLALGLLLAAGGAAAGIFAFGGLAVGMFAFGGAAIGSHIAIGGYAQGHIAVGDAVRGAKTIALHNHGFSSVSGEKVENLIRQEFPRLCKPLAGWIASLFG